MYEYQTELSVTPLKVSVEPFTPVNLFFFSCFLTYIGCITYKQWYKLHINTNFLAMIPIYSRVLCVIEKALQNLMEEYFSIEKSLQDLVEGQKKNMA